MSPTDTTPARAVPVVPELAGVHVGCDVTDVRRFAALLGRRPRALAALFTDRERTDATRGDVAIDDPVAVRRLAARFAAKEAVVKLLGRPRLRWSDVEIHRGEDGAPALWLLGRPTGIAVSLSHDGDTAFACVVATDAQLAALPPITTRTTRATTHPR